MAGLVCAAPARHWPACRRHYITVAASNFQASQAISPSRRGKASDNNKRLTIQVEVHVCVGASARIARKLSACFQRLRLLAVEVDVEVARRVKVNAGVASVVDVVKVGVEEIGEVLDRRRLGEQVLLWRRLIERRDVLGHVGPSLPLVG